MFVEHYMSNCRNQGGRCKVRKKKMESFRMKKRVNGGTLIFAQEFVDDSSFLFFFMFGR